MSGFDVKRSRAVFGGKPLKRSRAVPPRTTSNARIGSGLRIADSQMMSTAAEADSLAVGEGIGMTDGDEAGNALPGGVAAQPDEISRSPKAIAVFAGVRQSRTWRIAAPPVRDMTHRVDGSCKGARPSPATRLS
jgi:hypothetical protein